MKKHYNSGGISTVDNIHNRRDCPLFEPLENDFDKDIGIQLDTIISPVMKGTMEAIAFSVRDRVSVNVVLLAAPETLGL